MTVILVIVANFLQPFCFPPVSGLPALHPVGVVNDGIPSRLHITLPFCTVEEFDVFDGVARFPHTQSMTNHLIQVDEDLITKKFIDLVFPCRMAAGQAPEGCPFVIGVMIYVHAFILLPAGMHPIHEAFKSDLFPCTVMCPPILEFQESIGFDLVMANGTEQVFKFLLAKGVTLHVKIDVQRGVWREFFQPSRR